MGMFIKLFRIKGTFLFNLVVFSLVFWPNLSNAIPVQTPPGMNSFKAIPSSLLKWPEQGADYIIIVDKSTQKIFLYCRDNFYRPVKVFNCSTGENRGPKSTRNDKKTPEGIYFFTRAYLERELPPIYGDRAFAIDYPNPLDKREKWLRNMVPWHQSTIEAKGYKWLYRIGEWKH